MEAKELKLMNFLRWLYDETRNDFVKIPLVEKAKEYELPQNGTICTILFKLGILEKKFKSTSKNYYKWKLEEAPTYELVMKIIKAIADHWRSKPAKKKPIKNKEEKTDPDTSIPKPKKNNPAIRIENNVSLAEKLSIQDIIEICHIKGIHGKLTVSETIEI